MSEEQVIVVDQTCRHAARSVRSSVDLTVKALRERGSKAVPGFMRPEGVVVFHEHARTLFKVTLERDEQPKSLVGK